MKINSVQNYSNPSFGIKVSEDLLKMADSLYFNRPEIKTDVKKSQIAQKAFNKIYRKAKYMEEHYGFNDYTIVMEREHKDKKTMTALYALKDDNSIKVLLTVKDNLNKVMEKFTRMNEYVLSQKINQAIERMNNESNTLP